MGEYIKVNGQSRKLGTCEDLYYVSFEYLASIVPKSIPESGNANPADYLEPGWRYRFPFPDETGDALTAPEYERSVNWAVTSEDLKKLVAEFEHHGIQTTLEPKHGKDSLKYIGATVNLPCPQSDKWTGHAYSRNVIGICQQKSTVETGAPELWTVVCCPFCGCKTRLPEEAAILLVDEINARFGTSVAQEAVFWRKIAVSILEGYTSANAFKRLGKYTLPAKAAKVSASVT